MLCKYDVCVCVRVCCVWVGCARVYDAQWALFVFGIRTQRKTQLLRRRCIYDGLFIHSHSVGYNRSVLVRDQPFYYYYIYFATNREIGSVIV